MFKRNWLAIAQVQDYHLRLALSFTEDRKILAGFAQGFPHLFLEGEDEGPLRIPLSALVEASYRCAQLDFPDPSPLNLWEIESHFRLSGTMEVCPPVAHEWEKPSPIPPEILSQFVGMKAEAGIVVNYRGRRYMVWEVDFTHIDGLQVGSVFESPPELDYLSLVDANFVALDK